MAQDDSSLYFAFGSNLSSSQMQQRCPASKCIGVARLRGWRWFINQRGYANIFDLRTIPFADKPVISENEMVFGLIYRLDPLDEERLDDFEGVPWAYEKVPVEVEMKRYRRLSIPFSSKRVETVSEWESSGALEETTAVAYIDKARVLEDKPKEEYVHRMRRAVRECAKEGVPTEWLKEAISPHVDLANALD